MKEKESKPIKDRETTKVVSFGTETNKIVVETIASFGNMMNYKNAITTFNQINQKDFTLAIVPFEYDFKKSKEYKLVYSQVIKIIVDGQETDKTEKNFDKVLDRNKTIFEEVLATILGNSDDVGFTIKVS